LHEQSTAVPILRATNAAQVVTLDEKSLPEAGMLASALEQFIYANDYSEDRVHWEALEKHSARESARLLAKGLDEALAQNTQKLGN
jgi:hypothetical protein